MKLSRALLMGLFVTLVIPLFSCSKNKEKIILAEVKDRKITLAKFEKAYSRVSQDYIPQTPGLEGLEEFLITMLNKEIMAYKADELGYDKDPTVVESMDSFMKIGLQVGYLKLRVGDKVEVTEDDVKFHYDNFKTTLSIKQILVDRPDVDFYWSVAFTALFTLSLFAGVPWGLTGVAAAVLLLHVVCLPLFSAWSTGAFSPRPAPALKRRSSRRAGRSGPASAMIVASQRARPAGRRLPATKVTSRR